MSEEVQDPRRNVPRALAIAGAMVLGVYILISWTILTVLPADQVTGLTALPDTARVAGTRLVGATMGGVLASLVALCLGVAAFGTGETHRLTAFARHFKERVARKLPLRIPPEVERLSVFGPERLRGRRSDPGVRVLHDLLHGQRRFLRLGDGRGDEDAGQE